MWQFNKVVQQVQSQNLKRVKHAIQPLIHITQTWQDSKLLKQNNLRFRNSHRLLWFLLLVEQSYLTTVVTFGSLQHHWYVVKERIIHNACESGESEFALADILMTVKVATKIT
jgi:hypothetical protein